MYTTKLGAPFFFRSRTKEFTKITVVETVKTVYWEKICWNNNSKFSSKVVLYSMVLRHIVHKHFCLGVLEKVREDRHLLT